jgi:hypothetical protein
MEELLENPVLVFNRCYYVSCINMLNGMQVTMTDIVSRLRNYDLLRAMAYFALDMKEQSLNYLNREMQNHDNAAAKKFISDYFENQSKTDVQKWCAEHRDLYELQIIDTEAAVQNV